MTSSRDPSSSTSPRLLSRLLHHPFAIETARYAPLVAALFAPAATLYDIPALTQRWYALDGAELPDPRASLVLSGFSLALSLLANALLVLRFTVHVPKAWRFAIFASTVGWVVKTCIGVANLVTFGATTRNGAGYTYLEAFWCAIVSTSLGGLVSSLLLLHYLLHSNHAPEGQIRFEGRTFIVSELTLFGLIALEALIFSQIEGWTYLEGIYFSVVAMLSIGFGDFEPTKPASKVLLFPFAIMGIVLLSNQISLIVGAASKRVQARRQKWSARSIHFLERYAERLERAKATGGGDDPEKAVSDDGGNGMGTGMSTGNPVKKLAQRMSRSKGTSKGEAGERGDIDDDAVLGGLFAPGSTSHDESALRREIARLHRLAEEDKSMSELLDLLYSALTLLLFWVVGAVIFHFMEGWDFGDAFYFNYVFFLTIGFGDFSPQTPVGRTVFVVWALLAVPIMTNFVVQTIQAIVERLSKLLALTAREKRMERRDIEDRYYEAHDVYIGHAEQYNLAQDLERGFAFDFETEQERSQGGDKRGLGARPSDRKDTAERDIDRAEQVIDEEHEAHGEHPHSHSHTSEVDAETALRHALSLATFLEAQARSLLVSTLSPGSAARLLLQADANVQTARLAELDEEMPPWMGELRKSLQEDSVLDKVKKYRVTYARMLVAGRRVLKLEGERALAWERRGREV